jgi:chaperonin cofactor prefoldin
VPECKEGEQPPESPQELLTELETIATELTRLIQRINQTNSTLNFRDEPLSNALAERDVLRLRRIAYDSLINAAAIRQERYMRSELRLVSTVDVAELQRQVDRLSRDYRQLDAQIQAMNWASDLIES